MTFKLLAVGDIHLGRWPSGLPEDLKSHGLDPAALSPAAALTRAVGWALESGVDAVLMAGDLIDSENRFFESWGALARETSRLARQGIPVFAVAGNHDLEVLPRLANQTPGLRIIGEGGTWETIPLEKDGRQVAWLCGWSFPPGGGPRLPLATRPDIPRDGRPVIGLLHTDLDGVVKEYAPTPRAQLELLPPDAWLLGHIHKPSLTAGDRPLGYLGSLTPLDPSETGPRGPWLIEIGPSGRLELQQIALAPLRWETAVWDVGALDDPRSIKNGIAGCLERTAQDLLRLPPRPLALGLALHLEGRTPFSTDLRKMLKADDPGTIRFFEQGTLGFVERTVVGFRQAIDLGRLSQESGIPGLLARRLLTLELDPADPERRRLITESRQALVQEARREAFQPLGALDFDDDQVVALLSAAGWQALETVLDAGRGGAER